jgi:DNA polymerase-3 subunit gamma/tau
MDQVIRYIRVFSELSGQIRYASQKRVLIEIALIKLCKPAMETRDDSLLDRIREIENKLEQGTFMTAPAMGEMAPANLSAPVVRPVYTKALSEEVKAVASKWSVICADAPNPMKIYLKAAHPSVNEAGRLLLVLEDGVSADYFKEENNRTNLTQLIEDFIEREIEIEFKVAENRRAIEQNFPDLTAVINNMDIEVEE